MDSGSQHFDKTFLLKHIFRRLDREAEKAFIEHLSGCMKCRLALSSMEYDVIEAAKDILYELWEEAEDNPEERRKINAILNELEEDDIDM